MYLKSNQIFIITVITLSLATYTSSASAQQSGGAGAIIGGSAGGGFKATIPSGAGSVMGSIGNDLVSSAPGSGFAGRSPNVVVRLVNNCFGTNLRGVSNPISPDGVVTASFRLARGSTQSSQIQINYPGSIVTPEGVNPAAGTVQLSNTYFQAPSGSRVALTGNIVEIEIPGDVIPITNLDAPDKIRLDSPTFSQQISSCDDTSSDPVYGSSGHSAKNPTYACGQFMGKNGALTPRLGPATVSPDGNTVEIQASFPGQTGFCGGFWSPLMVFFDDKRPKFTNISDFPLNLIGKTHWPEAKSPGYWIAIDQDGSGKIDQRHELFGQYKDFKNGFEALRDLDTNKDGVIDAKDKDFSKLVLWNDKNGDGKSQKTELISLATKLASISLKYQSGILRPLGPYAEERERSVAITVKGKKVEVIDIWLAPALKKPKVLMSNHLESP